MMAEDMRAPRLGQVVAYRLTADDAAQVNRRRTTARSIAERIPSLDWPMGAQAHIGRTAHENDDLPMIIVRVTPGTPADAVNGQVFLDGTDILWKEDVLPGDVPGTFRYLETT
jgi:hypothetical protein